MKKMLLLNIWEEGGLFHAKFLLDPTTRAELRNSDILSHSHVIFRRPSDPIINIYTIPTQNIFFENYILEFSFYKVPFIFDRGTNIIYLKSLFLDSKHVEIRLDAIYINPNIEIEDYSEERLDFNDINLNNQIKEISFNDYFASSEVSFDPIEEFSSLNNKMKKKCNVMENIDLLDTKRDLINTLIKSIMLVVSIFKNLYVLRDSEISETVQKFLKKNLREPYLS